MERRRDKILHYLELASATFVKTCSKLIRTGVCDRVFKNFDFFSTLDRDVSSPRASKVMKRAEKPRHATEWKDDFGDTLYRMYDGSSSDESQDSENGDSETQFSSHGASRPRSHDYEAFILGFFYFFVLQDPFIRQFLELKSLGHKTSLK